MKSSLLKSIAFIKGFILVLKPNKWLGWLQQPALMASNTIALSRWISRQSKKGVMNDFYTPYRNYQKREKLFNYVVEKQGLKDEPVDYLEFGVFDGGSFKWWVKHCQHKDSKFYGFDTFEGLPEDWGVFKKGEMHANIPIIDDERAELVKGLFQQSLPEFLKSHNLDNGRRKVIHLDADLFSSTLYSLTSLAPYIKKGDILMFDEFNVPNHEFYAYKVFTESYYIETELIGAVNNYYQVALQVK